MQEQSEEQKLLSQRIIWAALTMSIFLYTFALYHIGKLSFFAFPDTSHLSPLEIVSLNSGLLILLSLKIHKAKVSPADSYENRMGPLVACLAINEAAVLLAFAATFVGNSGNAFFMALNVLIALIGNGLMFPREIKARRI